MVAKGRRRNFILAYMLVKQFGHLVTSLVHPAVPWWLPTVPRRLPGVLPHTCNIESIAKGCKRNFTLAYKFGDNLDTLLPHLAHPAVPWWLPRASCQFLVYYPPHTCNLEEIHCSFSGPHQINHLLTLLNYLPLLRSHRF